MQSKLLIITLIFMSLMLGSCAEKKEDSLKGLTAEQLLEGYKESLDNGAFERALEYLQEIEAQFPFSDYAQQAILNTAYVHYRDLEPEKAIAAANRFLQSYPTNANADYAFYLKGLANYISHESFFGKITGSNDFSDRDPNYARASFDAFNELITRFPDSRYAPDSGERMRSLLDTLARYDMRIARFYYQRNAYVAALNRAKFVLERYQETPSIEDALGLMILSYQKMGIVDLADDSKRVLLKNYPNSHYIVDIDSAGQDDRNWWHLLRDEDNPIDEQNNQLNDDLAHPDKQEGSWWWPFSGNDDQPEVIEQNKSIADDQLDNNQPPQLEENRSSWWWPFSSEDPQQAPALETPNEIQTNDEPHRWWWPF